MRRKRSCGVRRGADRKVPAQTGNSLAAYSTLGLRSANSTRGGHDPPGRTGEPCTGGSGTGGRMTRSCEVRVMRSAEAGQVIVRGSSEKATGELIDTETVTISSEGGRWKRAARHLAGGLPYRTHGAKRGGWRNRLRHCALPLPNSASDSG